MSPEPREVFPKDTKKTYGLMALVKGTSPMVEKGPEDTVMSWPNLLVMEALAMLGTGVLLLAGSILVSAPLREMANPDVTENPAKAPWYFLNLQELLMHMHPALAGVVIPGIVILLIMMIPYFDRSKKDIGVWFASPKGRKIALVSTMYTLILIPATIIFDEFVRVRSLLNKPEIFPGWIIPIGVTGGLIVVLYAIILFWRPNRREVLVGLFTGFVVTYFLLILSGTLFRGMGMRLTLPWDLPPGALTF